MKARTAVHLKGSDEPEELDFTALAETFTDRASQGLMVNQLFHQKVAEQANVYPSTNPGACLETLIVVSLTKPRGQGRGHLTLDAAVSKLLDHVGHICPGTTRAALITDSWDAKVIDGRLGALNELNSKIHLEIYLVTPGGAARIQI